jgi:hypothetical protein
LGHGVVEGSVNGVPVVGSVCLDLEVEGVLELLDVGLELGNVAAEGGVGGVDVWRRWWSGVVRSGVGVGGVGVWAVAGAGVVPALEDMEEEDMLEIAVLGADVGKGVGFGTRELPSGVGHPGGGKSAGGGGVLVEDVQDGLVEEESVGGRFDVPGDDGDAVEVGGDGVKGLGFSQRGTVDGRRAAKVGGGLGRCGEGVGGGTMVDAAKGEINGRYVRGGAGVGGAAGDHDVVDAVWALMWARGVPGVVVAAVDVAVGGGAEEVVGGEDLVQGVGAGSVWGWV